MSREQFADQLGDAIKRLRARGRFQMDLDYAVVVALVAQLQLALRHPANVGETAEMVRSLVGHIIDRIGETEPGAADILRMGFVDLEAN